MMGHFALNSISERRLMQAVDRRRPAGLTKRESVSIGRRILTCISELNYDSNDFLRGKQKLHFCDIELRRFDDSKSDFTLIL